MPPGVAAVAARRGWSKLIVGLRPESLELATEGLAARVQVVEEVGADAFVFCTCVLGGSDGEVKIVARTAARDAPERETRIALRPRAGSTCLRPRNRRRLS